MPQWSDGWKRRVGESPAEYVARLEAERAGRRPLTPTMRATLNRMIDEAKRQLSASRSRTRRTGKVRPAAAAEAASPALLEIMRLFPLLSDAERERFFSWYADGMTGTR